MKFINPLLLFIFAFFSTLPVTHAMDYPELLVTPLASERLTREAKEERGSRFRTHLTLQTPAAVTLVASLLQFGNTDLSKDENKRAALGGSIIGGAWLAGTLLMSMAYTPYLDGYRMVKSQKTENKKDRLARERTAEQSLLYPGSLAAKLSWFSFLSNAGISTYMFTRAKAESISKVASGVAMVTSLIPLIFKHPWWRTANEHEEYKKKIYGPVVESTFFRDSVSGQISPGLSLAFRF